MLNATIYERIIAKLEEIALLARNEDKDWGYPEWTKRVKSGLGQIARDCGYKWYASGSEHANGGEWLLDGVAWHYDRQKRLSLPFVMESEWRRTSNELERDFQKLMVIRSDLRLMVFNEAYAADANKRFEHLVSCVEEFRDSVLGDRYLLACRCWETKKFIFRNIQAG